MADFSDIAGGILSGAGAGSALGVPGAIAGGLVGLGSALFGGSKKPAQYDDKYGQMMAPQIASELQSNQGAQAAAHTAGMLQENANLAMHNINNSQEFAGNQGSQVAAYNSIQHGVQSGITGANIQGAQLDLNTRQKGLQDLAEQQRFDFNRYQDQRGVDMQPSLFSQNFGGILTAGAGSLAGLIADSNGNGSGGSNSPNNASVNHPDHSAFTDGLPDMFKQYLNGH